MHIVVVFKQTWSVSKLEVWTETQKPSPDPKKIKYTGQVLTQKPELDQKGTTKEKEWLRKGTFKTKLKNYSLNLPKTTLNLKQPNPKSILSSPSFWILIEPRALHSQANLRTKGWEEASFPATLRL